MIGRAIWGRMACERSDDGGAGGGGPRLWKIIRRAARLCWSKLHRQKRYYDDRSGSEGELRARQELSRWKTKEKTEWEKQRHDGRRERYGREGQDGMDE